MTAENRLVKQESVSDAPTASKFNLEFTYDTMQQEIEPYIRHGLLSATGAKPAPYCCLRLGTTKRSYAVSVHHRTDRN
jgi:hypothetical protein